MTANARAATAISPAGGDPGVYLLDKSGHGPFIPATGEPIG